MFRAGSKKRPELGGLELLEQAIHALKACPVRVHTVYYLGTIPYWAVLIWFVSTMSHGITAELHVGPGALLVAVMYIWMKAWQALAASMLREFVSARPAERTVGGVLTTCMSQALLHVSSLVLLPVAGIVVIPLIPLLAFYQSASVAGITERRLGKTIARATRYATAWPYQNAQLLIAAAFFGCIIFINAVILAVTIPELLQMLFGLESTTFAASGLMLSTTTLFMVGAVTYMLLDPILKAAYVLRAFYYDSLVTAEDLRAEFATLSRSRLLSAIAALAFALLLITPAVGAQKISVPPTELRKAVEKTLEHPRYTWREAPQARDKSDSKMMRGLEQIIDAWEHWRDGIKKRIGDWLEKIFKGALSRDSSPWISGSDVAGTMRFLAVALTAILASIVGILLYRMWRAGPTVVLAQAVVARPDVSREDVTADQLPEDEWMKLARELLDNGETRLALRALFLAGLAAMAQNGFIFIARYKTNHDYEREVRRRAHVHPQLPSTFSSVVGRFEEVWYGLHNTDPESIEAFTRDIEVIRGSHA